MARNAAMAVAQVVVSGGTLFVLYRYLLQALGPEQVGIWSLVVAVASVTKIGEMGLAGSALKYTALYLARGDQVRAAKVVQTTLVSIGVALAILLGLAWPLLTWGLARIVPASHLVTVFTILPYALLSVWVATLSATCLSALDGCQRIDLRAKVYMVSSLILLVLVWLLVPRWGLQGLVWAQIGQGAAMFLLGWGLLRREIPALPWLRLQWDAPLFREMFHYGASFQLITLLGMLVDPATKALMTLFGGLSVTAYYEMANRMVAQFRALLVAANQAVVPQIANLHENAPSEIDKVYAETYKVIFFLSLPLYAIVVALAPLISKIWIGHYEVHFVVFAALFALAYWINTLSAPAYFVNLGTGRLGWNVWAAVLTSVANVVLGYLFGTLASSIGVAWGAALATMAGSGLLILGSRRDRHTSCRGLLPAESRPLLLACCFGLSSVWATSEWQDGWVMLLGWSACLAMVVPVFWMHPQRRKLSDRFMLAFRTSGT